MPLHVDRTTVQAQAQTREHVLDATQARAPRSTATGAVATPAAAEDASPVLRLLAVSQPDGGDVETIDQADALVRSLLAGGGALGAHGALDPSRVGALLAG